MKAGFGREELVDAFTNLKGRDIDSTLNYAITRAAAFERLEPKLPMRGIYRYMADAGLFTECSTGQRWARRTSRVAIPLRGTHSHRSPNRPLRATCQSPAYVAPAQEPRIPNPGTRTRSTGFPAPLAV